MFQIDGREVSITRPPYVIAELSANHNGSFQKALDSILAAKNCGADAVKIQTYTANTMTIDSDRPEFIINDGLWKGYKLFDLYHEAHTPFEWHKELFDYARKIGITLFSSPFDESAIELLESLNCPAYKIASFEITDLPLIAQVAQTKKPMFISTGMASEVEISEALEVARSSGARNVLLFHCVSSYPAPIDELNLKRLVTIKKKFDVEVGLSDHSRGSLAAVSAVALGATAIEKHFTLSRSDAGPDSSFSIEPDEFSVFISDARNGWLSIGSGNFSSESSEMGNLIFRRSLFFVKNLKAGHIITTDDVRRIRPGYGLSPKYFNEIIGMKLAGDVLTGEPVTWGKVSK